MKKMSPFVGVQVSGRSNPKNDIADFHKLQNILVPVLHKIEKYFEVIFK